MCNNILVKQKNEQYKKKISRVLNVCVLTFYYDCNCKCHLHRYIHIMYVYGCIRIIKYTSTQINISTSNISCKEIRSEVQIWQ